MRFAVGVMYPLKAEWRSCQQNGGDLCCLCMQTGTEPWRVEAGSVGARARSLVGSALSRSHALTLARITFSLAVAALAACAAPQLTRPPAVEVAVPTPRLQPERWIVVRKTAHTLSLYEGTQLLKLYPIVLGKDPHWAKLYQGDHRTPEGEYHVVNKYFHPFWSRFMMLDYPTSANEEIYAWSRDHGLLPVLGRSVAGIGGAIGIHGTEDESLNRRGINWTEGCVSLFNHDVEELYDLVPIGTRVVIER
jgi:murein L,D-transpeptidase YafK